MRELRQFLASRAGEPCVLLQHADSASGTRWLFFSRPLTTLVAERQADVVPVLAEVEKHTRAGRWVAGFLTYEAAPALDPALASYGKGWLPLVWWGVFEAPQEVRLSATGVRTAGIEAAEIEARDIDWQPALPQDHYREALRQIHEHIAAGDTYQVNYTFPLEARLTVDPAVFFADLCRAQRSRYSAFIDTRDFALCSASPELFFSLNDERIVTRPMKGTARRGRYPGEDAREAAALRSSEKNRAENLMIVDMMRNDLGRIATPGSITVDELFAVEKYPTIHQLTSTVSATTQAPIGEILRSLFPSASITGAPKIATSHIIKALETGPRGAYTGSIGFMGPGRRAQMNVAIRTATINRSTHRATYGTGGGIVWDSSAAAEYEECRTKALVLRRAEPHFSLLETLVWRPRSGYFLLDRHLERLLATARYFDVPLQREAVQRELEQAADNFQALRHRIRLMVHRDARIELAAEPWACSGRTEWNLVSDDRPIDASDPFLFHKTTHRAVYEQARRRHSHADEVVLWNSRGELTESTRANLVLLVEGRRLTPPVECGLLAGTYRAELLARGKIHEHVLTVADFEAAEEVFLINSVRGWIRTRRPFLEPDRNPSEISHKF